MFATEDANLSDAEFERLSDLVYKHCGINLHEGKKDLVRARLAKQMRVGGFPTASAYIDHVLADKSGNEFVGLIDALSTNLTSFFRESNHFDHLAKVHLPRVMADRRKRGGPLRLRGWSAGCSSGEEPYTLTMTVLETIAANGGGQWDFKLLATDISTKVLGTARQGTYDAARAASIPVDLRGRYFAANKYEGRTFYDALPALKNLIAFRRLNLMEPWPFAGPFDFIFCRNVMIYFDKPTQERLVNRYHDILAPGGLLFTGHSESLTGVNHKFKYVQPTIYAKS